jgi:hypothetical protein
MRSLIGQTIFSVGDTVYLWADVVLAAELRGEWSSVVRSALTNLAALEKEAAGEEELVSEEEIEAEADRFRYDRDLVSVDDTEKWLGRWGLDVDAWLTWIRAGLLRRRFAAEGDAALEPADASEYDDETVEGVVQAEAACSGALARFANTLASQVAIVDRLAEDGAAAGEPQEDVAPPVVDASALLPGFPAEDLPERIRGLLRFDRAFAAFRAEVVTPAAVAARVKARQGDWMRIRCRILTVPGEDVAREALLSIREDGDDMADVAAGAGGDLAEGTYYLEELEKGISDRVLAARSGELVGPVQTADGWVLVDVVEKRLASPDDEEVRKRAEESLFEALVERELDNRVTWRWGR